MKEWRGFERNRDGDRTESREKGNRNSEMRGLHMREQNEQIRDLCLR